MRVSLTRREVAVIKTSLDYSIRALRDATAKYGDIEGYLESNRQERDAMSVIQDKLERAGGKR